MDALESENSLKLEVKDFGPILKAKIDLRPLTVFIGPSNTGKSYLAVLIYALHRFFTDGGSIKSRNYPRHLPTFTSTVSNELSETLVTDLLEFIDQIPLDKKRVYAQENTVIPSSVLNAVRDGLDDQGKYFGNELSRCFGIEDISALIRNGHTGPAHISFRKCRSDSVTSIGHDLTIGLRDRHFNTIIPDNARAQFAINYDDATLQTFHRISLTALSPSNPHNARSRFAAWELLGFLADHVRAKVAGPFHLPAYYLPADRTGVMHAHNVVVSALIESAAMAGLRPAARTPILSGVLADFLEQLIHLDGPPYRQRRPRHSIDTQMERLILGGSIRVEKSQAAGYPHFTYRPTGWKNSLSLMNASSMVSELAPVVLYLRHLVEQGNVLIVEEPESHLHPEMQVQFTRQLAELVTAGVRVIVTTHSEWVLEELANVVRRSGLPTLGRGKPLEARVALRPDQVGAWLFKKKGRPKGSTVEEITLDEETGLYPTDYDAVREELYNESMSIFNRIAE